MKKFLFYLIFIVFLTGLQAQNAPNAGQTAWYKQTAVVDQNAKRGNGDNTGQFIAFTKMGCYDSNKEGYDVGNGFLEYKGLENNIHVYYGDTFWGKGNYFFNSDFSRLNIRTDAGITYVYEKTNAPAATVTSAKIVKKLDPVVNTSPPTTYPTYTPPTMPNSPSVSGGGSTGSNRTRCAVCTKIPGKCNICGGNYQKSCTDCNGTGQRLSPGTYGTQQSYVTCWTCNGKKYIQCSQLGTQGCRYGNCGYCNGTGYIN
jgi:hypothetical protein